MVVTSNLRRQQGATTLGMIVVVVIVGVGLLAALRLAPKYFEYFTVVKVLDRVAQESSVDPVPEKIRMALSRSWQIESIKSINYDEVEIRKVISGYELIANYRAEVPLMGNLSLVVDFSKTVIVP